VVTGVVVADLWWLILVGLVSWVALGAVTLLDRKQLRCVERWLGHEQREEQVLEGAPR
jgi:hypothetical protein